MNDTIKKNNDLKVIVTNFASRAYIAFVDTDLVKELLIEKSNCYT